MHHIFPYFHCSFYLFILLALHFHIMFGNDLPPRCLFGSSIFLSDNLTITNWASKTLTFGQFPHRQGEEEGRGRGDWQSALVYGHRGDSPLNIFDRFTLLSNVRWISCLRSARGAKKPLNQRKTESASQIKSKVNLQRAIRTVHNVFRILYYCARVFMCVDSSFLRFTCPKWAHPHPVCVCFYRLTLCG